MDWSQPTPTAQSYAQRPSNSAGTWSLILGILGLACLGPFAGVPAIILGHIGRQKAKQGLETNGSAATIVFWLGIISTGLIGFMFLSVVMPQIRLLLPW